MFVFEFKSCENIKLLGWIKCGTSNANIENAVGESWQHPGYPATAKFNDLVFTGGAHNAYNSIDIAGAMTLNPGDSLVIHENSTFADFTLNASSASINVTWSTGYAHTWTSVTMSGSGVNQIIFVSDVPATQWDVILANPATVNHVNVSDSNLTGQSIDASDETNIDNGNNSSKWIFDNYQNTQIINPFF